MLHSPLSDAGMTLIEVVLAVAILSVGIVVLSDAAAKCLSMIRLAKNYQIAHAVIQQGELDYPMLPDEYGEMQNLNVQEVTYQEKFQFSRTSTESEDEDGMYVVHTAVSWSDRGQNRQEEVVGYLYNTNKLDHI